MSMHVLRYVLETTKLLFVLTLFSLTKELYVIGNLNSFNSTPLNPFKLSATRLAQYIGI